MAGKGKTGLIATQAKIQETLKSPKNKLRGFVTSVRVTAHFFAAVFGFSCQTGLLHQ